VIQQAFGDQILSRTQVFQWYARFMTDRTSVDVDQHTGRPTSCTTHERVTRFQEHVRQDRHRTIHDIAEEVGIGYGTCQRVLMKELSMHHVAAKFVPRILTAHQKQQQFLAKHKMAVVPHPPCSPDLAPCDFFLFSKMKMKLKGRRRSRPNRRECLTLTEKDF
jgi:hypothetical protein